jgi:PEP-CTERM motif
MKIRVSFLLPAFLFAATLFAPTSLHASSLAPGCIANTLSAYERINSDSECSVGILNFDSFIFVGSTGTGGAVPLTASQIELTPCNGVIAGPGTVGGACFVDPTSQSGGFSISALDPLTNPFAVGAQQTETYTIDWRFIIDPGPVQDGASLGLDPVFGGVNVTQTYCVDSFLNPTPCSNANALGTVTPQTISVDNTNPPASLVNSVTFGNPALVFADVRTVITLTGCTQTGCSDGAGFDAVTGTATIVNTPEPATVVLVGSGLLLLGALRKRAARV